MQNSNENSLKQKVANSYNNIDKDKLKENSKKVANISLSAASKTAKFTGDVAQILSSEVSNKNTSQVRDSKSKGANFVADASIATGKVAALTSKIAFKGISKAVKSIKKK